jgi:AP-1 complex subunit gamma-1
MSDPFGAPAPTPTPAGPKTVRVPALSHGGLSVEFECSKPDTWNKQKSDLIAHFTNSSGSPIYGMNLQVAVPKYVTMEMQPPSSTTIPQSGGNAKGVTQNVSVTNTMLGTKNLVLKLKLGFTLNGQKMEQMATCSGFPAGEY